jgi:hypothetical protein
MRFDPVTDRARIRSLFEEATGLEVAHYPKPRGWDAAAGPLLMRADRHTFAVLGIASSSAAPVDRASRRLAAAVSRLEAGVVPLLLVPFMGSTGARLCRESGTSWIDAAGNACVEGDGLRVRIEGRPNPSPRRGRPATPFAPRSSRVARDLLHRPRRWVTQSTLAARTRLGPGFVSRIVRRLEEDGLLDRGPDRAVRPADPRALLEAWKHGQTGTVRDRVAGALALPAGSDLAATLAARLEERGVGYALGGSAAAARRLERAPRPTLRVWVEALPDSRTLRSLGFVPGGPGAPLWLTVPGDPSVLEDAGDVGGVRCVSPVQIYLDLAEDELTDAIRARIRDLALGRPTRGSTGRPSAGGRPFLHLPADQ